MNVDRTVFTNSADIILETTNGHSNHIWINTARRTIYTGMGAGDSKLLYKYYENADEFISWIVLYTQQRDGDGDSPLFRCIKGNQLLWEGILHPDNMGVDEIFDRVRSLDETTAVWLLSGGDIYGDE
jgi:hypothetical protein